MNRKLHNPWVLVFSSCNGSVFQVEPLKFLCLSCCRLFAAHHASVFFWVFLPHVFVTNQYLPEMNTICLSSWIPQICKLHDQNESGYMSVKLTPKRARWGWERKDVNCFSHLAHQATGPAPRLPMTCLGEHTVWQKSKEFAVHVRGFSLSCSETKKNAKRTSLVKNLWRFFWFCECSASRCIHSHRDACAAIRDTPAWRQSKPIEWAICASPRCKSSRKGFIQLLPKICNVSGWKSLTANGLTMEIKETRPVLFRRIPIARSVTHAHTIWSLVIGSQCKFRASLWHRSGVPCVFESVAVLNHATSRESGVRKFARQHALDEFSSLDEQSHGPMWSNECFFFDKSVNNQFDTSFKNSMVREAHRLEDRKDKKGNLFKFCNRNCTSS